PWTAIVVVRTSGRAHLGQRVRPNSIENGTIYWGSWTGDTPACGAHWLFRHGVTMRAPPDVRVSAVDDLITFPRLTVDALSDRLLLILTWPVGVQRCAR